MQALCPHLIVAFVVPQLNSVRLITSSMALCQPMRTYGVMLCRELVFEADGTIGGLMSLEGEKVSFVESVNPAATGT
jgi:hypothetical protein